MINIKIKRMFEINLNLHALSAKMACFIAQYTGK